MSSYGILECLHWQATPVADYWRPMRVIIDGEICGGSYELEKFSGQ